MATLGRGIVGSSNPLPQVHLLGIDMRLRWESLGVHNWAALIKAWLLGPPLIISAPKSFLQCPLTSCKSLFRRQNPLPTVPAGAPFLPPAYFWGNSNVLGSIVSTVWQPKRGAGILIPPRQSIKDASFGLVLRCVPIAWYIYKYGYQFSFSQQTRANLLLIQCWDLLF